MVGRSIITARGTGLSRKDTGSLTWLPTLLLEGRERPGEILQESKYLAQHPPRRCSGLFGFLFPLQGLPTQAWGWVIMSYMQASPPFLWPPVHTVNSWLVGGMLWVVEQFFSSANQWNTKQTERKGTRAWEAGHRCESQQSCQPGPGVQRVPPVSRAHVT